VAEPKKPQDLINHNCINLRPSRHSGRAADQVRAISLTTAEVLSSTIGLARKQTFNANPKL